MKGSIVIMRNIEDVFGFISNPENLIDRERTGWISFDPPGPVSAGSIFNAAFKVGPIEGSAQYEVKVYERPFRLAFLVTSPPVKRHHPPGWPVEHRDPPTVPPMEDIIELRAAPGGTRLTRIFGAKSKNPVSWMLALPFSPLANWGMRRDLRRLKARAESVLP